MRSLKKSLANLSCVSLLLIENKRSAGYQGLNCCILNLVCFLHILTSRSRWGQVPLVLKPHTMSFR